MDDISIIEEKRGRTYGVTVGAWHLIAYFEAPVATARRRFFVLTAFRADDDGSSVHVAARHENASRAIDAITRKTARLADTLVQARAIDRALIVLTERLFEDLPLPPLDHFDAQDGQRDGRQQVGPTDV